MSWLLAGGPCICGALHSGLREAIGVNADGSLLPARVPLGEYTVEYYDEASAMAMALTSATVRVLPGDASWILVAIPKDGLLQGTGRRPCGFAGGSRDHPRGGTRTRNDVSSLDRNPVELWHCARGVFGDLGWERDDQEDADGDCWRRESQ